MLERTRWDVRHLAAGTTVLTFLLILLGVYTAASASGLACSADWPLCSGGVLPQTLPGFIEWFHRFVAMITGFAILGTTVAIWRAYDSRRIRGAAVLALVVTPVQALLGGATVIQYTPVVQTAHHGAAMVIFAALLTATLWAFDADAEATAGADTAVERERRSGASARRSDD